VVPLAGAAEPLEQTFTVSEVPAGRGHMHLLIHSSACQKHPPLVRAVCNSHRVHYVSKLSLMLGSSKPAFAFMS
jgi:hypothetical protein